MATLATTVDGLKLPNPFVIGSGPPGTNLNVISKAFKEGWGAVIAKTVSLDASKVVNVTPRYGKLHSTDGKEVIGWENIELISDRPFKLWEDEFKRCKDMHPQGVLIASIMEEYEKGRWEELVERTQACGVDAFELNFGTTSGKVRNLWFECAGGISRGFNNCATEIFDSVVIASNSIRESIKVGIKPHTEHRIGRRPRFIECGEKTHQSSMVIAPVGQFSAASTTLSRSSSSGLSCST